MSFLGGSEAGDPVAPRNILMQSGDEMIIPGPCVLDVGTAALPRSRDGGHTNYGHILRAGCIMAQITAAPQKWVPCKLTTVTGGGSGSGSGAGSAVIPVVDARFFIVGETISVQPRETGKTPVRITRVISAVDYANNLITVAGGAIQYNTGDEVYVVTFSDGTTSAAGVEIPRGILVRGVSTKHTTDIRAAAAGTLYPKPIQIYRKAYINSDYALGDYAACRATAVNHLGGIQWSDRQQSN